MVAAIALSGVRKVYADGTVAVDGIDLEVAEGEFVALLGPTGCGKTSILRIIAGLESATEGEVRLAGQPVDEAPARKRRIAMVFQDFALYPHLTAAQNIAFPLHTEHADDATITAAVAEVARLVGVEDLLHRKPAQLSGGQRQRVAMARAIVRRPVALLLDEPLSNVDAAARAKLRGEISRIIRQLRVSTLYVTHDQTEAMTMSHRIGVMRRGRIEQIGTPSEVYGDPQRLFVAAFVGTPRTSLLEAAVYCRPGDAAVLDFGEQSVEVPWGDRRATALAALHSARVTVGIRPDALTVVPAQTPGALHGRVSQVEHLGYESIVVINVGGVPTAASLSHLELPDTSGRLAEALTEEPAIAQRGDAHRVDAQRGDAHRVHAQRVDAHRVDGQRIDALRSTLARLVPHQHGGPPPATARTRYGFYPVYERDENTPAPLGGTVSIRLPVPARVPRIGEALAVRVDMGKVFLFDHRGDRIRLPA